MRKEQLKLLCAGSVLALACNFQYGFSSTYLNTPIDTFKSYLNSSISGRGINFTESTYDWMWNLLLNIWFVGFFFGVLLSPILNGRYGRKVGFLVGNGVSFLASIIRVVAIVTEIPELLIIARVIISITAAITYEALILYLQECSPTPQRGMISYLSEMSFASMCFVGMCLGTKQAFGDNLTALLGFAIIPCALAFLVLLPIPETPKFLYLVKGDSNAAAKSVTFFHGNSADVSAILGAFKKEAGEQKQFSTLKEVLTTPYLRRAILLACLALQNTVGMWSLLLSSTRFLRDVNLQENLAEWSSTVMTILYVVGTVFGFLIVNHIRRRVLLLSFTFMNNLFLAFYILFAAVNPLWTPTKYGCLFTLWAYGFTYGAGVGPVSWILCAELTPQRHRALVQSICYSVNVVMVVISTFTVLPLYDAIGSFAFLILYLIPSCISLVYLFANLPETNGREIYEIVNDLQVLSAPERSVALPQIS